MIQCSLEQRDGNTIRTRVAYLPNQFAEVGLEVRLKTAAGWLSGNWKVVATHGHADDAEADRLYTAHRAFGYYEAKNRKGHK